MVFDFSGQNLYISNSTGVVQTFHLSTLTFGRSYDLGGYLNGMDIARDDSFLLVAQNATSGSQGTFHRVDLATGAVTNLNYALAFGETGSWDVAIGSNGLALTTTRIGGSGGSAPLRQIDLATNAISVRSDTPDGDIGQDSQIHRSADGTRFFFIRGAYAAYRPSFIYNATTNTFPWSVYYRGFSGAVNRNGSLIAIRDSYAGYPTSLNAAIDFNFVHNFAGVDSVAFDASSDVVYGVNTTTDQIIAYNTQTYAELFRLDIGEDLSFFSFGQFGTGVLVASSDGHWLALETPSGIRLFSIPKTMPTPTPSPRPTPTPPPNGSVLIPSAIRRDMVFDFAGQNLYISNSTGTVRAFNLSTLSFGATYELGGSLNGMDISRDNSFLLVAQNVTNGAQGTFHKVDLTSGMVTNINYTPSSGGAWDVAIGSNGLALATTVGGLSPVRQINLTTNAISIRSDAPGAAGGGEVFDRTEISRSADGARLVLMEGNISSGPIFTYSATDNTFGPSRNTGSSLSITGAVNRNGSLVALGGELYTAPNLSLLHTFDAIDYGVSFSATGDILYGFKLFGDYIVAYNTQTFAELYRFTLRDSSSPQGQFGAGMLVASADGKWLALSTLSGIRLFQVSGPTPPPTRVVSRKLHGGVPFDIDLPVIGDAGIECRSGGANGNYQIVFTFPNAVTFTSASVTSGTGSVSGASGSGTTTVALNLTGVTNMQTIAFTLFGVNDGARIGDVGVAMGVLLGDTNGSGTVTASDVSQTKMESGQLVTAANCRADVNVSGSINASDVAQVKAQSGTALP
ncbi:MAG: dockerin type I domain-containing protein [Chthoniobacterales bacterium]